MLNWLDYIEVDLKGGAIKDERNESYNNTITLNDFYLAEWDGYILCSTKHLNGMFVMQYIA